MARSRAIRRSAGLAALILVLTLLPGCAFRGSNTPDFVRPYSRNSVVAAPTLVGNVAGALATAPLWLPMVWANQGEDYTVPAAILMAGAIPAGFALGTPFVLPALLFEEDPWRAPSLLSR